MANIFILQHLQYASEVHSYNTRYATQQKLYKPHVKTNTGKQMISFKVIDLRKSIPQHLKDLNVYTFAKNIKDLLTLKAIATAKHINDVF